MCASLCSVWSKWRGIHFGAYIPRKPRILIYVFPSLTNFSQFLDYAKRFDEIMNGVEDSYHNGRPMHISQPSESVIATLTYTEYLHMPPRTLHSLLAEKNVVVTGVPTHDHGFDEKGLNFIHPLHNPVSLQGTPVTLILFCRESELSLY